MENNIEIIGQSGNIYLAINKSDEGKPDAKCVAILYNNIDDYCTVTTYDTLQTPTKFNAFTEVDKDIREDVKTMLMQKIRPEDTTKINDFLKD